MTGIYMQEMCIYVTDKRSNCALVGSQLIGSTLQWEAKVAACFQFSQEFQNFLRFYFVVRDIEDCFHRHTYSDYVIIQYSNFIYISTKFCDDEKKFPMYFMKNWCTNRM